MRKKYLKILLIFSVLSSCITQFIPKTGENREQLVVEGLITDRQGFNSVKLSKSLPLGLRGDTKPLGGCKVWITDDLQNSVNFDEYYQGTYYPSSSFSGVAGRKYTLHIKSGPFFESGYTFESMPMELKPVPAIDSIYYENKIVESQLLTGMPLQGFQIFIDTHDPTGLCKLYRWDYTETWEFHIPFSRAINPVCWITENSMTINIKNTSVLSESVISRYPLSYITNQTDRLKVKYSILVNQYSLNEDEYLYWEKLQNTVQNVGSLYDIIPASIPGNIICVDDPAEKVLGYFSVSGVDSKRIFIKDHLNFIPNMYGDCVADTLFGINPGIPPGAWILNQSYTMRGTPYTIITYNRGCVDCTVRGTKVEPSYWRTGK